MKKKSLAWFKYLAVRLKYPVLVGEAGVGKTALAYGLAQRIVDGEIPYELQDMRVLELDMMSVVAGTRFRGDFEERMNQIISDIEEDGHIICLSMKSTLSWVLVQVLIVLWMLLTS